MSGEERKILLRDVVVNSRQERRISHADWMAEGRRRFGEDVMRWKFVCPSCGHVASVQDWKDVGATEGEIAFSCIGRHLPNAKTLGKRPGPCNYAGGGLFKLNPVTVTMEDGGEADRFEFAGEDPDQYNYTVAWSDVDGVFVARVIEFQSLAVHGDTEDAALKEIKSVVQLVIEDLLENNEPIPKPVRKNAKAD